MIEYAIFSILLFRAFINSKNTTFRENAIHLAVALNSGAETIISDDDDFDEIKEIKREKF